LSICSFRLWKMRMRERQSRRIVPSGHATLPAPNGTSATACHACAGYSQPQFGLCLLSLKILGTAAVEYVVHYLANGTHSRMQPYFNKASTGRARLAFCTEVFRRIISSKAIDWHAPNSFPHRQTVLSSHSANGKIVIFCTFVLSRNVAAP
jgi:hypothetical protein